MDKREIFITLDLKTKSKRSLHQDVFSFLNFLQANDIKIEIFGLPNNVLTRKVFNPKLISCHPKIAAVFFSFTSEVLKHIVFAFCLKNSFTML